MWKLFFFVLIDMQLKSEIHLIIDLVEMRMSLNEGGQWPSNGLLTKCTQLSCLANQCINKPNECNITLL